VRPGAIPTCILLAAGGWLSMVAGSDEALPRDPCELMQLEVASSQGARGSQVQVEITGGVSCEVTGFSIAIGHDPAILRFTGAEPGAFLVSHSGADLSFQGLERNAEGYAVIYGLFDISFPLTVPPAAIPADTVLALLRYEVLAGAPLGPTPLLNRSRFFGSPNPIANVYSGKPGEPPIEPELADGAVTVTDAEPEGEFLRGDSNDDEGVDISDAVWTLGYLFQGSPSPPCLDAADSNDDGELDISDPIHTLGFLFQGSATPPPPGPFTKGSDPTLDPLGCRP